MKIMTTTGNYKGNPTITLKDHADDKYGFTFGKAKARLILANLDAIREFAGESAQVDPMGVDRMYEDQCQQITGA